MSIAAFQFNQGFKARGGGLPSHSHEEAQLTYAASGMVQVHTDEGRWLVPPQLAVWIPAGVQHRVDVLADAELWMVHWAPSVATEWAPSLSLGETFAFRVTPLMQALLTTAFKDGVHGEKAELVAKLMLHELTMIAHAPTFLPMPSSADGLRVADIALADHRGALSVDELASRAATSVRSLSRRFSSETGLSFKTWRQRARIVQAMDHLYRGTPVARVAAHFGFSSSASFSHAFRQVTNLTPTAFLCAAPR